MYRQLAITAEDIAEVIAFAVTRPRRMTLNEILVRPTAQPLSTPDQAALSPVPCMPSSQSWHR